VGEGAVSLPAEGAPNYALALANARAPKQFDVLFLSNDDCASLVASLQADLSRLQYVCAVKHEDELAQENSKADASARYPFLMHARKVVWMMTSSMWNFPGCVEAAKAACMQHGMDVVLIRQDGSMWVNKTT